MRATADDTPLYRTSRKARSAPPQTSQPEYSARHQGTHGQAAALADLRRMTDQRCIGVIVVDAQLTLADCTSFAQKHLHEWGFITVRGILHLQDPREEERWQLATQKVLSGTSQISFALRKPGRRIPIVVHVSRSTDALHLVVLVRDPTLESELDTALLRNIFGMTERESQLAGYLACGNSISDFAANQHLAMNTVRTHLKQVFKKMGVRSQTQLVAVVSAALH